MFKVKRTGDTSNITMAKVNQMLRCKTAAFIVVCHDGRTIDARNVTIQNDQVDFIISQH